MEVLEGLDDVSTNQRHAAEAPLVQDADVEGRGIQLLLGQVLCIVCVIKFLAFPKFDITITSWRHNYIMVMSVT